MKQLIKRTAGQLGAHVFSDDSLPTGVNWLHDIRRAEVLGPQPVCFDVGANIGQTVAELRQAFAGGWIHAFEPFAEPRAALLLATRNDRRVTVVPRAMGAAAGSVHVAPRGASVLNSLVGSQSCDGQLMGERIDIGTIDQYCDEHGLDSIDVLKTDTEGYDLEVLRGAAGLLGRQRVSFVYSEVTFLGHNGQNTAFAPVFDFLSGLDYRFLGLYETYPLHHYEEPCVFCNALFVSRAVRDRAVALRRRIAA